MTFFQMSTPMAPSGRPPLPLISSLTTGLAASVHKPIASVLVLACATVVGTPAWAQAPGAAPTDATGRLAPVVVTGTREALPWADVPQATGVVDAATIRRVPPAHPGQLIQQVPGAAVAVTNGEGHTTAIRQPFTTSPVYLFLEDGLPIRPTGFFNHNALYEVNLPQAGGVEVVRGPGTALYGSDAIGGIVNVLTPEPTGKAGMSARGEAGQNGWGRVLLSGNTALGDWGAGRLDLNRTHAGGWRDGTQYDRTSGTLRWDASVGANATLRHVLAFSNIDQQTGANSPLPLADYLGRPTLNLRSIAYRQVDALRLSSAYERDLGAGALLSVTPYVRDNRMTLLASFSLPSDPTVYTVSNRSAGVATKWRQDFGGPWKPRLIAGLDADVSPGERLEHRLSTTSTGSGASRQYTAYTVGSRVYDYDVTATMLSPYLHVEASPLQQLRLTAGLRRDHLSYDFSNRITEAVVQGAAGAFYGQVQRDGQSFAAWSPKWAAHWTLDPANTVWLGVSHGFRAPSEGQLFRPSVASSAATAQALAQAAASLRPIKADQVELGWRQLTPDWRIELVVYELTKRDDLVAQKDPVTNVSVNVNAGRTEHRGVELGLGWALGAGWRLDTAASYARHTYAQWVTDTSSGRVDYSGKEMEAAPRIMASTRLGWVGASGGFVQLEWVRLGSYFLEATNSAAYAKYPGHDLFHLSAGLPLTRQVSAFARLFNLSDKRWADSAQVSSSTAVYSPGLPRTLTAGLEARW
jgi:iron complex outermembrane receptor protein